ncbi:hypothetical protein B0T11DRAFT_283796 [Plectosphaerella cucumerina]|uniref:Uncharacterized protein n=1 Tax=Plectosphaerella cucumerina TaxID=40658 RepID=A0A8K0X1E3_9PEZI|nr:hypothetical protein B0T11DRAFT_283796 [Plectosphaerella cucumerina]
MTRHLVSLLLPGLQFPISNCVRDHLYLTRIGRRSPRPHDVPRPPRPIFRSTSRLRFWTSFSLPTSWITTASRSFIRYRTELLAFRLDSCQLPPHATSL